MEITPQVFVGAIGLTGIFVGLFMKIADRGASKRKSIYERIEEERKDAEDKYVPIKVCEVTSRNIEKKLDSISTDVKTIISKNGWSK